MFNHLANGRENKDGADQGFLTRYLDDLLYRPMFHPTVNGTDRMGFIGFHWDTKCTHPISVSSIHSHITQPGKRSYVVHFHPSLQYIYILFTAN